MNEAGNPTEDDDRAELRYWIEDTRERPEVVFGRRLRKLRTGTGMSQTEVASQVSALGHHQLHQTAIAKIEAGTRPLRLDEAFDIAHVFNLEPWEMFHVTADDLLGDVPDLRARILQLEDLIRVADEQIEVARLETGAALKQRTMFRQELEAARRRLEAQQDEGGIDGKS